MSVECYYAIGRQVVSEAGEMNDRQADQLSWIDGEFAKYRHWSLT